ncbi:MAG: ketopantoate reductase family protein [Propionibacteriales bacterium]|nr:ketopantoate reductase family protein [Propionibacteriales bacterium]
MRYVVYGAGAVGGVVGALLHQAGQEVVLIARGAHHDAISRDGLRLETPAGASTVHVVVVEAPDLFDWRADDLVLLGVKSDATAACAAALSVAAPPTVAVVSLQNGVANESTLLRWFERVYGVCVMAPTGHVRPGVVEAHCHPVPAILDIGRYPGGIDETAETVSQAFVGAGIVSQPRPDIIAWKYRKLIMNLGNAVQAVCGRAAGTDELRTVIRDEGEATLAAAGIESVSEAEDRDRRGDILQVVDIAGRPRMGGSSWQSLERRTGSIETDYLNGEIVLLGRWWGVPTPANELIRREASRLAFERCGPGIVDPHELLDRLGAGRIDQRPQSRVASARHGQAARCGVSQGGFGARSRGRNR